MTELRRRPSARQSAVSILQVLACVCLVAGVVMAVGMVVGAADDPNVTAGERLIAVVMALSVYGPGMVLVGWPISIPVVLVVGLLLAYLRLRYQRDRKPPAAARTVLIVLVGYAGAIVLTWAVLLFAARGLG